MLRRKGKSERDWFLVIINVIDMMHVFKVVVMIIVVMIVVNVIVIYCVVLYCL